MVLRPYKVGDFISAAGIGLALTLYVREDSNPASPTPNPPAVAANVTITIVGMNGSNSYSPTPGTVKVGQTVVWRNADSIPHTATADAGSFNTGTIAAGPTSSPITMTTTGSFPYHCAIHGSAMVGHALHQRWRAIVTAESAFCFTRATPGGFQVPAQQVRFNRFRREYNDDRPHEALSQETPTSVYRPSSRPLPRTLALIEYPGHYEVRLVSRNSGIRWKHHWVCVTHTLAGEYVGLEEIDDGIWEVYFEPLTLGRMDERILRIEDHKGRTVRKTVSPMSPD